MLSVACAERQAAGGANAHPVSALAAPHSMFSECVGVSCRGGLAKVINCALCESRVDSAAYAIPRGQRNDFKHK